MVGQSKLQPFGSNLEAAKKDFCQKFKDKTKNDWAKRSSFKPVSGKYTLIEIDYAADAEEPPTKKSAPSTPVKRAASSTLPKTVQDLMNLIFDMVRFFKKRAHSVSSLQRLLLLLFVR